MKFVAKQRAVLCVGRLVGFFPILEEPIQPDVGEGVFQQLLEDLVGHRGHVGPE